MPSAKSYPAPPGQGAVLITGCSSGIGRALTDHLLRAGKPVIATARDLAKIADFAARPGCICMQLDVADRASIQSFFAELPQTGWDVDILVNNAGYGHYGPVEEATWGDLERQFAVNVFGLWEVTRGVIPLMRGKKYGRIINISSLVGLISFPFGGVYAASKFALEALTTALRQELKPWGIYVIAINPGPIHTNFATTARGAGIGQLSPGSLYTRAYQKVLEKMGQGQSRPVSPRKQRKHSPELAVKIISRACLAPKPRYRYYITAFARTMAALNWLLPERLFDYILRKAMGIEKAQ